MDDDEALAPEGSHSSAALIRIVGPSPRGKTKNRLASADDRGRIYVAYILSSSIKCAFQFEDEGVVKNVLPA